MFANPAKATKGQSFPLKVVVMSATLEMDKLSSFLGDCPVFTIPGRTFPVTCTFGSAVGPKDIESTGYVKEVELLLLLYQECNKKSSLVGLDFILLFDNLTAFCPQVVKMALDVHTSEMAGDILVFLTGQ